ncbi:MAG: Minf_1886 family protein [Phycisphaerae bacterium]
MARLERAVLEDGRYPLPAFEFLNKGLQHATQLAHGQLSFMQDAPQHVSGQALCLALEQVAKQLWGGMALAVLHSWNIRRTRDFGEMVFLLVKLELLGTQDSDRIEDFDDVYDFRERFGSYRIALDAADEKAEG